MKVEIIHELLKSRLSVWMTSLFVFLGVFPFLIIGGFSYTHFSDVSQRNVEDYLLYTQNVKVDSLKEYSALIREQITIFSKSRMVIQAVQEFGEAYANVEAETNQSFTEIDAKEMQELAKKRYAYQQHKTLNLDGDMLDSWMPKSKTSRILQYFYITSNPFEVIDKRKLDFVSDGSSYSLVHQEYHPFFRDYMEGFHYSDIYLLDLDNGNIIYSTEKKIDFATSVLDGPHKNSKLAAIFKNVKNSESSTLIHFTRFSQYEPSYNQLISFVGMPVFAGERKVGVIVFQLTVDKINSMMSSYKNQKGEKETNESFLLAPDFVFRTDSRFQMEDSIRFTNDLRSYGIAEEVTLKIKNENSVINILTFKNDDLERALKMKFGVISGIDYRGKEIVFTQVPVQIFGEFWTLVTAISEGEAYSAMDDFMSFLKGFGVLLLLLLLGASWGYSRRISLPLEKFVSAISQSTSQISTIFVEHERVARLQVSSIQQLQTTVSELSTSSLQTAHQAQDAATGSEEVVSLTQEGNQKVDEMLEAMNTMKAKIETLAEQISYLSEQISQIGEVTVLVTDFANETKMLALNAAVEAARAGEQGKGFSVLSEEIRKLANDSKGAADLINSLVEDVRKSTIDNVMITDEGAKLVDIAIQLAQETETTFNAVADSIGGTSKSAQQISLNIRQQAEAIGQGLDSLKMLAVASTEGAEVLSQTRVEIQKLENISDRYLKTI